MCHCFKFIQQQLLVCLASLHFCSCKHSQLFGRSLQWRFSNHDWFLHTQLHTRLTELLLTAAFFVMPFHMRTYSVWWRCLKCVRIHAYLFFFNAHCCWFTWKVFDVFVGVYLCCVLNDITLFLLRNNIYALKPQHSFSSRISEEDVLW